MLEERDRPLASVRTVGIVIMGIALALVVLACPHSVPVVALGPVPAQAAGQVLMSAETRQFLNQNLSKQQVQAVHVSLPTVGQNSLGPQPLTPGEHTLIAGPSASAVTLDPRTVGVAGDGSAANPYVGAIAAALAKMRGGARMVVVPAGVYEELELSIPAGTWLRGEPGTVLVPPAGVTYTPPDGRTRIVHVGAGSGLVGFEIDGSRATGVTGVYVPEDSDGAVIATNTIHDIPDRHGIAGVGTNATVIGNLIERTGRSGVRTGSGWLVRNNVVRYAGIDRPDGGGGDDGIIAGGDTTGTMIENNHVVSAKKPNGRHAIATQSALGTKIRGNLCILEGQVRGGIVLSDRSSGNLVTGNVIICVPKAGARTALGILGFGSENVFEGNVVVGTDVGCTIVKPTSERNVIRKNTFHVAGEGVRMRDAGSGNQVGENAIVIGQ